jgi:prepilin-type N-terminal cleavage/methylation domain-containing protein/prepilin-type processing-associated H-X9-DG protein
MKKSRAFSLVELLVVITVITILLIIGISSFIDNISSAKMTKELAAAKTLMSGMHAYSIDNNGKILPGYDPKAKNVTDDKGNTITHGAAAARYAWRLAPYIDYNIDNVLLVNNTKMAPKDDSMYQYLVSVYTSLGMNVYYVGGHFGGQFSPDHPRFRNRFGNMVVTNLLQAHTPSKMIVFASVYSTHMGKQVGCWEVDPPSRRMSGLGNVDYRWKNKAVVAYLDGHVELNDKKTLSDMRLWSNPAAQTDNPIWSF